MISQKIQYFSQLLLSLWFLAILYLAFFNPILSELFLAVFAVSFVVYWFLLKQTLSNLFYWGLAIRIALLFSPPSLHEHWYLMLQNGQMLNQGLNPFSVSQDFLFGRIPFYPPLIQWLFWLSAQFDELKHGVFVLKIMILIGELGVYWMAKKLMQRFNLHINKLAIYWLNPLVVLELLGNVHFEGIALFFLLFAAYSFTTIKDTNGAFNLAFSVLSSFASLLFLPLFVLKSGWKRSLKVISLLFLILFFCFLPFFSQGNFNDVFAYFKIAFHQSNFNLISFVLIILISYLYRFRNRLSLFTGMLLIHAVYLLFSPFIHPWSIVLILGLAMFSNYKFPIIWTLLLVIYHSKLFESEIVIFIQYLFLLIAFLWEIKNHFTFKKFIAGMKS